MTLLDSYQVVVDQFSDRRDQDHGRKARWPQVAMLLPAAVIAGIAWLVQARIGNVAPLLTATSILTGFTFTMAVKFWDRSISARSNPAEALDGKLIKSLDHARTHLIWTVAVGVAATAVLALVAIFVHWSAPLWVTPIVAFLVMYQLTLVIGALVQFYEASYTLR